MDKKSEQLGMPSGTAAGRLRKNILFSLLKRLNENFCYQCGGEIEFEDELSIEHKVTWLNSEDPKSLFFDLDNIAFSHLSCNSSAARVVKHKFRKTGKFKGIVYPTSGHLKYRVKIKGKFYGSFDNLEEAIKFHDQKVIEFFGKDALTNEKLGLI